MAVLKLDLAKMLVVLPPALLYAGAVEAEVAVLKLDLAKMLVVLPPALLYAGAVEVAALVLLAVRTAVARPSILVWGDHLAAVVSQQPHLAFSTGHRLPNSRLCGIAERWFRSMLQEVRHDPYPVLRQC